MPPATSTGTCGSARRRSGRSTTVYVPGPKWYRWWDFGNGTMRDLGSHWNDLPFWALKLQAPLTVEASGPPPHPEIAPASMQATYEYAARGDMPPVKLTWYQGDEQAGDLAPRGRSRSGTTACCSSATRGCCCPTTASTCCCRRRSSPTSSGRSRRIPKSLGPLRRVDPRLQDRRADDVQLRVRRLADRGEPPGQRRLPRRQEARVGRGEAEGRRTAPRPTRSSAASTARAGSSGDPSQLSVVSCQ